MSAARVSGATDASGTSDFALSVTPQHGLLSTRRKIRVTGAVPGSLVTLRAETQRGDTLWSAQATFLAQSDGTVSPDLDAPVSGDFRVADSMGLWWAQHRDTAGRSRSEPSDVFAPLETTLTAWAEQGTGYYGVEPAAADQRESLTVTQSLLADGVTRSEIADDELVGTVFTPAGDGPHPTIIVMNGSGGGINEARASLYAAAGIQAVALGYFKAPGLSPYISRTPLEYFERGIAWVTRELSPLGGKPLVSGQSRGGELTLLLASRYAERIAGLVAFVPAAFVFGAQGAADPAEGWDGPTWTLGGEPLEHLWHDNAGVGWQPWNDEPAPTRTSDVYVDGLHDRALAAASRIEIERFGGPVACVAGLDDRAWPSSMFSRITMQTLERAGHRAERLLLDYAEAGHGIGLPHLPATEIARIHPVSGVSYSNGGTPWGIAKASEHSFAAVCEFVHRTANQTSLQSATH